MHLRNIIYCRPTTIIKKKKKKKQAQKEQEERAAKETAVRQKVPFIYRALGRPHFIARLHRRRCTRAMPKRCAKRDMPLLVLPLSRKRETVRERRNIEEMQELILT